MSAIDQAIDQIIAEKNDAIAKMEWWRKEAERWRNQALDLDAHLEEIVSKLTTRMSRIESNIQNIKDGY